MSCLFIDYWSLIIIALGLFLGSFANVLIYRLPKGESILLPGSYCPNCRKSIRWYDNVPVFSYILLKGKCRDCKTAISLQYPVFELLTALSLVIIWFRFNYPMYLFIGYALFVFWLIVISGIDFNHRIIPDELSMSLIVIGLLFSPFNLNLGENIVTRVLTSVIGGISGPLLFYIISYAGSKVFKKEALGGGDIKLVAGIGVFLGWYVLIISVFLGSLIGTIVSLILILLKKKSFGDYLPYGPFLSLGAFLALIFL